MSAHYTYTVLGIPAKLSGNWLYLYKRG